MSYEYMTKVDDAVNRLTAALKKESKNGDTKLRNQLREEVLEVSLLQQTARFARDAGVDDDDIRALAYVLNPGEVKEEKKKTVKKSKAKK